MQGREQVVPGTSVPRGLGNQIAVFRAAFRILFQAWNSRWNKLERLINLYVCAEGVSLDPQLFSYKTFVAQGTFQENVISRKRHLYHTMKSSSRSKDSLCNYASWERLDLWKWVSSLKNLLHQTLEDIILSQKICTLLANLSSKGDICTYFMLEKSFQVWAFRLVCKPIKKCTEKA